MSLPGGSLDFLEPWTPVLGGLALLLGVLAFRLYRRPEPEVSPPTALLLGSLRAASLVLIVLLLLAPVLSRETRREVPPGIVVLLDASASMSLPFPRAEEEGASPTPPPTRADRVAEALAGPIRDLRGMGRVELLRFGGEVVPADPDDLLAAVTPSLDRTDPAHALAELAGARRHALSAVVLVSDGVRTAGADPVEEAARLGVPVVAVGVGDRGGVTDVSIAGVSASPVAYLDNRVPISARIRSTGGEAREMVVFLSEGEVVLDSVRVGIPEGGALTEVKLHYEPHREGLHRYRVWTPEQAAEISTENNEHPFAVRVLAEKIRVLLVAGRPGFDTTFLKRALEADVSLSVDTIILSLRELGGVWGGDAAAFPAEDRDLAQLDLVVLADVRRDDLSAREFRMLRRFVEERGGALALAGPPEAFDLKGTALVELLPVDTGPRLRAWEGQIFPRLTPSGATHPVTQLLPDPAGNERRWSGLPPIASAPVFDAVHPGGRVLVRGEVDGVARRELPLIVAGRTAGGRVLLLCGAPYWKWDLASWGLGRPGDSFRRLVSRGVRWLVARDDLRQVSVRPAKNLFDGAEEVVLEGRVFDDDFRPVAGADVRSTIRGPVGGAGSRSREVALVDQGNGRYHVSTTGLPPGDYVIESRARLGEVTLGTDEAEMTVTPFRLELVNPGPDPELLREVARASGGAFIPLTEASRIPSLVNVTPVVERTIRELPFRESPVLFAVLVGLLGLEWGIRKRRGLP
ncbi:MAG: VWA domain-containing protein [Gemmatimonadota bacterium]|nr:VWA domain-containing protein [Gemmatimonadota bacterium]